MPRGGYRGGLRPYKTKNDPRLPLACRVQETNRDWVKAEAKRSGWSIGELTNFALELYREQGAIHPKPCREVCENKQKKVKNAE